MVPIDQGKRIKNYKIDYKQYNHSYDAQSNIFMNNDFNNANINGDNGNNIFRSVANN